jgi:TrmH family RNA methyltransferase
MKLPPEHRSRLRVVLVETRNPLNVGAAARAMVNFGFAGLRVVNPYELAWREARSAVGAAPLLQTAEEFASVADAVSDCALVVGTSSIGRRTPRHAVRRLEYGARVIRRQLASAPVALVFGSEKYGLGNPDLSHCHWLLRIATEGQELSMNLGQAVAVCLYELARDARAAGAQPGRFKPAPASENEQITRMLLEVLERSGYVNPVTASSTKEKVRRLVRRFGLSAHDTPVVLGMLRQMLWKLHGCE